GSSLALLAPQPPRMRLGLLCGGGGLLGRLLGSRLARSPLVCLLRRLLGGALLAALREQLGCPLEGDGLDGVVLAEGGVVLTVGDGLAQADGLGLDRVPWH